MTITPEQIERLRGLLREASPLDVWDEPDNLITSGGSPHSPHAEFIEPADAQLIAAAAVNALPGLLDRVEGLEQRLEWQISESFRQSEELNRYKKALEVAKGWVYEMSPLHDFPEEEVIEPFDDEIDRILAGGDGITEG